MPHLSLLKRIGGRLLLLLAGVAVVAPVPAQLPARIQDQLAATVPPVASAQPAPAVAASAGVGPALQLIFTRAVLPDGRVDESYPPVAIARGGSGGYDAVVVQGALPDGLRIADGLLQGTPSKAGRREFVLEVRDSATPPQVVRQPYTLHVAPARVAKAGPRPASSPAPASAGVPKGGFSEETLVRPDKGFVTTYTLREKHLKELAPVEPDADATAYTAQKNASAREALTLLGQLQDKLRELGLPVAPIDAKAWAAEAEAAPPPPPGQPDERPPNLAQLNELLEPLVDVEYPTLELFDGALRGRQCQYLRNLLEKAFTDRNPGRTPPRVDCPGLVAPAVRAPAGQRGKASVARSPVWPLRVFHDSLLPTETRERAIELARELHPIDQATQLSWDAAPCGCVPRPGEDSVYGIFPFWRSQQPLPAIDFSHLHRISTFGLQLDDDMKFPAPPGWQQRISEFTSLAQRHDVRVDLLLQRNDWQVLERQTPDGVKALAERAADNAVEMADLRHGVATRALNALLLPLWRRPEHAFAGITVMFEESADARPRAEAETPRFHVFFRTFVLRLIERMQASGRSYALNIVVPNSQVGVDGAFSWTQLVDFIHKAERKDNRTIPEGSDTRLYVGTTDITVSLLVPLPEPVTLTKKQLRQRIDDNRVVVGHNRVALLNSIVPVVFHPSGAGAPKLSEDDARQLNDDLAYYKWNFGGVSFWPPAMAGQGGGDQVQALLHPNFFRDGRNAVAEQVCVWVCPNRTVFQLLWQAFTLVALGAVALLRFACSLRRHASVIEAVSWATGIVAVLLTIALVTCDPALARLNGDAIAIVLLVAIGLVLAWRSARPDVSPP